MDGYLPTGTHLGGPSPDPVFAASYDVDPSSGYVPDVVIPALVTADPTRTHIFEFDASFAGADRWWNAYRRCAFVWSTSGTPHWATALTDPWSGRSFLDPTFYTAGLDVNRDWTHSGAPIGSVDLFFVINVAFANPTRIHLQARLITSLSNA